LLAGYARYAPEDMLPDSQTWGHSAAIELLNKVDKLPLAAEVPGIVDEMLRSSDEKRVWLGTTLAVAGTVGLDALERARDQAPKLKDLPAECLRRLHHTWASAVEIGRIPWEEAMRDLLPEPWATPLLGAALVCDHPYTMGQLPRLLGSDLGEAKGRFASAVSGQLRLEEVQSLVRELHAKKADWGEAWTNQLVAGVQWSIDHDSLAAGLIRWEHSPASPSEPHA